MWNVWTMSITGSNFLHEFYCLIFSKDIGFSENCMMRNSRDRIQRFNDYVQSITSLKIFFFLYSIFSWKLV